MARGFFRGLSAYVAVVPLFSRLGLWRYVGLTAGISLAVLIALVPLALLSAEGLRVLVARAAVASWVADVFALAAALALIGVGLLTFKHLVLIAAAPWLGPVAERVLAHVEGQRDRARRADHAYDRAPSTAAAPAPPLSRKLLARSLRLNFRLSVRELLLSAPLLVALLIPGVNLIATALLFGVQSYFVGAGALDYALEGRHDYRATLGYLRRHRGVATGIGVGFMAMLLLAVGFLVAPAWSVAAGAYAVAQSRD